MNDYQPLTSLIRRALWGEQAAAALPIGPETFQELQEQRLSMLITPVQGKEFTPPELAEVWKKSVAMGLLHNARVMQAQAALPLDVPYVVLKGTSAARYYPHPEYRIMGDIDLMTSHEDYLRACDTLLANGYNEVTQEYDIRYGRHRQFEKNSIEIEVHSFYAQTNDVGYASALDSLIIGAISETHVLPDMINGLTLLAHVNQHMESGLGMRQIIDWMMFVDRCLPDSRWEEFRPLAEQIGLEKLAVVTTRMCEMYLGLPERKWCAQADEEACAGLFEYALSCGNFGFKQTTDERASVVFLSEAGSLGGALRLLKKRGIRNWEATHRHRFLRPFAWLYQLGRFMALGLKRKSPFSSLLKEYRAGRKRNRLFNALGVTRGQEGLVYYRDGEYVKNTGRPIKKRRGRADDKKGNDPT